MRFLLCISFFLCAASMSRAQENIFFYNADSSIRFGGTLTKPAGATRFPTVILLSGTGKQDRSGKMAGMPVFERISAYLVNHGIAVLRTDDRGTGETTGLYDTSSTADFAADAIAAYQYLKSRKDIRGKIGFAGHSEGGAAACIAAASGKADFIITLAGLTAPGLEALLAQNQSIIAYTPGVSAAKAERINTLNNILFHKIYAHIHDADSTLEQIIRSTYAQWRQADDSIMKGKPNQFTDRIYYPIDGFAKQATSKWYRFQMQYDPARYLPLIKVPVLAINGGDDMLVPASVHLPYFKKLITYKGGALADTLVIPKMNHLLQDCVTCQMSEYSLPTQRVSEKMLEKLAVWINKQQ